MPRRSTQREVRLTLWLRATPAKVWKALTDERQLARWYTRAHQHDLRKGGNWAFRVGQSTGRVLALRRNKLLAHSQKDDPKYPNMRIEYSIEKMGKVTVLKIRHSGFGKNKMVYDCWAGAWPSFSCNLKTLLETGAPLWEGSWS